MAKLRPEIISFLMKKTDRKEKTIRKNISLLRRKYGKLPINAVAHLYALQNNTSVLTKLTPEEKTSLPNIDIERPIKIMQKGSMHQREKIIEFIKYETTDPFVKAHVIEINKTYTYGCCTATFILCRKFIENMLVDIIKKKYPQNRKENIELYFDTSRSRTKDFSEILSNLGKKAIDFGPDKALLERIVNRANQFKDDANNKAHSWYHIVRSRKEIDDTNFQDIVDMIIKLERGL